MTRTAICVAGWHFRPQIFDRLLALPDCDTYVVSHRTLNDIPKDLLARLGTDRILVRPNLGYDWGCYQQFLETNIWRDYEMTIFMHDDVVIRDTRFVDACAAKLAEGHGVVGNGRVGARYPYPRSRPHEFAHARWKPPHNFFHDCVRGSFFAASLSALTALEAFEVFWDPYHLAMTMGNHSLRASCARWESRLGPRCFAFLSDEYLSSEYLVEDERGGGSLLANRSRFVDLGLRVVLTIYMRAWWIQNDDPRARQIVQSLEPIVRRVSGT
jgi:hypothetical protein